MDEARFGRQLKRQGRRRPLGFGVEQAIVLVTPIAWIAVEELAGRAAGSLITRMCARIRSSVRRLLRRPPPPPAAIPPLTPQQLDRVLNQVRVAGDAAGLEPHVA